jgi:hypothetical protein
LRNESDGRKPIIRRRDSPGTLPQLNLGSRGEKPFTADADRLVTGRTCIVGASGSGKSYLVAVLCEELCSAAVPFVLIDTEGEYYTLKEKFNVLWVGDDERCDVRWEELRLVDLASKALMSQPIVLDLSGADDPRGVVGTFLSALYAEVSRRRLPYLVILEEADRFIPQDGERLPILNEVARRGRKRGLGLTLCTQRPSIVDKNVLSQCSSQFIGKLVIRNDLQAVSHFFPAHELPKQLTMLPPGSFYAMGDLAPQPTLVRIRERVTSHGGFTPLLSSRPPAPLMTYEPTFGEKPPVAKEEAEKASEGAKAPAKPKVMMGLPTLITPEEVPALVRRAKSFVLFGGKESIAEVEKVMVPLAEVTIRVRKGMLKKHFETRLFVVDARTGWSADLGEGISFSLGLSQVVGLESRDLLVLRVLEPDVERTAFDLMADLRISEDLVRASLRKLEERRLALSYRRGRVKVYKRSVDVPRVSYEQVPVTLARLDEGGTLADQKVREGQLLEVVRGLWDGGELENVTYFYYPLYRVQVGLDARTRTTWIDGQTGRQVQIPS